jgi:hypothetical protein
MDAPPPPHHHRPSFVTPALAVGGLDCLAGAADAGITHIVVHLFKERGKGREQARTALFFRVSRPRRISRRLNLAKTKQNKNLYRP